MPRKITRLRGIEASRVDGVDGPANGFPVLMMKAVDDSAPEPVDELSKVEQSFADYVSKKKHSAANRRKLAAEDKALPDGSYPIDDEEDLDNAAKLARSGHGDAAAAKRLIARRAKELGVENPLAAEKSAEEAPEAPEAPEQDQEVTKDAAPEEAPEAEPAKDEVSKAVEDAIAKAIKPLEAANQELRDELAKLKATPIPGGPALTAPADVRATAAGAEKIAKAAHYRKLAEQVGPRELKQYYADKANELDS